MQLDWKKIYDVKHSFKKLDKQATSMFSLVNQKHDSRGNLCNLFKNSVTVISYYSVGSKAPR